MPTETDKPSFQLHYCLSFSEGHEKSLKNWRSSQTEIFVTRVHAPLDNCSKKSYCKIKQRYFSSTIPLQSCSRVHLGNFFYSRFTAIFATSGFLAWRPVLSSAPHSTPLDFTPSAARALPDTWKLAHILAYTLNTLCFTPSLQKMLSEKKKKRECPLP